MRFPITLVLVALLLVGPAAAAGAQEQEQGQTSGTVRFVHEAEGAPEVTLELAGPDGGGLLGWWAAAYGATVELTPPEPLAPGRYELTIWPPGEEGTGGRAIVVIDDLLVTPGSVTTVTYYADDEQGRPVFVINDADGERTVRPLYLGTLVVEHDVEDGPELELVQWPLGYESEAFVLGTVAPGEVFEEPIDAGTHTLILRAGGRVLGSTEFTIEQDQATLLRVSDVIDADRPSGPEDPNQVRTPTRIETGAGGMTVGSPATTPSGAPPSPALLAALALAGLSLASLALRPLLRRR